MIAHAWRHLYGLKARYAREQRVQVDLPGLVAACPWLRAGRIRQHGLLLVQRQGESNSAGTAAWLPDAGALPVPAAAGVLAEMPGWLCASAGTANAADNANSAQIIFLMARANLFCFIFPLIFGQ